MKDELLVENKFMERLIEAMQRKNMNSQRLSLKTGIDKSSISCYRSGKYRASTENLFKIAQALGVNEAWLMGSDEVPMDSSHMTAHMYNVNGEYMQHHFEHDEAIHNLLIEHYDGADEKTKKAVRVLLEIGEENNG